MLVNYLLILLNTMILVSGQFLWKFGMTGKDDSFSSVGAIIKLMLSPYIVTGLTMYGFATVLWLFILTRVPLSVAYPIQSLAYVFAVFGAYFIFNEPLSMMKILGVLMIMIGVSFIGFSSAPNFD
ncbi:EamA family transporter [Planococcus sp. CP5-4]|uniref:EamA family transporter n=1 Tax=unclassified Planococcus (in: firmicutes) TaxID=2662419 RepID=UPI001C219B5F|nr:MULTISPECIES: EamA family transporter [unclassified Planococcus (in: firmicutes)]MBU9673421.1 EamA family transporter [Planococcus sp. CP5-4_YE]MBV0908194.1 EamA family transporter [Planococcus sp. CP5-4_UN]MBW6062255.1 EamA family transporter [Planococcus sp. CP5-4]